MEVTNSQTTNYALRNSYPTFLSPGNQKMRMQNRTLPKTSCLKYLLFTKIKQRCNKHHEQANSSKSAA